MRKLALFAIFFLLTCSGQKKQKTLEFWQFWTDPKAKPVISKLVADYEQNNPGWKINVTDLTWADGHQKIVVSFGANSPPDLLELGSDWIAEFAAAGALAKLKSDTNGILAVGPGIIAGQIYALPWFVDSRVLYINKSLLEKAGALHPSDWNSLFAACRKISSPDANTFGFGANSNEPHRLYKKFLPFVWSAGGDIIFDGRVNLETPELMRALNFYADICKCGIIESQKNLEDAFCDGKIGFVISGGWLLKRLKDHPPGFEYELALIPPETRGGQSVSFAGGEYLAIAAKTPNREAARKLLDFMIERDNSRLLCDSVGFGFPPYASQEIKSAGQKILFEQLGQSRFTPVHSRWVYIEKIIETMIESVMLGELSPVEAVAAAQRQINELVEN